MKNNGYTRIPNAIIRSGIPAGEIVVWCFIASMPDGYTYSVEQASAMLGINVKTWRDCVAGLLRRGMITVERIPGKTNVYEVVRDTEKWYTTPAKNWEYQNSAPLPKNGTPPLPKNGRGTHSNNKEQLNNNSSTTHACVRTRLIEEVKTDAQIERGCMALGIDRRTYLILAEQVFIDWDFQALPDSEWNTGHFLAVMRYKAADYKKRNNGTGQQTDGRADKDSTIAQLDRDTLTAMASLARKGQYIDKAPF